MNANTLYELSRRSIVVSKIEEIVIVWHNSTLTVRTEKGLHFLNYSHNLKCLDKNVDFIETFIPNPTSSPTFNEFQCDFIRKNMSNVQYTEMLLNPALWAHNPDMVKNLVNFSVFEWSPVDFLQNNQCVLAGLSNIGNVELYGQIREKWTNIFNLSSQVSQILEDQYPKPNKLQSLKEAAYIVHTCAICWSPTLVEKKLCYLVTAQKNGDILFWQLNSNEGNINAKLQTTIKSDTSEISTMLWAPIMQEKFLLFCCNLFGQILIYDCIIENDKIVHLSTRTFWNHKDRMIAKYMHFIKIDNNDILIYIKHRHFIAQMFDENSNILSQSINNINDHRLTNVTVSEEGIIVTAINFKIYKVIINIVEQQLVVTFYSILCKEPFTDYELHGIGFSPNHVMCALGLIQRKVLYRKEPIKIEIVFMTTEEKMESVISILLNNSSKKLTNYWDCMDLLRYKTMKTNVLPSFDYNELYIEGQNDVYKLKIYLFFLIIYDVLKQTGRICTDLSLPEYCIENVKAKILLNQALEILNNFKKNKNGSNFQNESFNGAKSFIQYYCQRHKDKPKLVNLMSTEVDSRTIYVCQSCDKRLNFFSCEDGHLNMFCPLSLTLIESDEYLVCQSCGLTARTELFCDKPMCLFCDLYLCVV